MTQEEYDAIVKQVAHHVDNDKNYPAAVALLQKLIDSDLPDIDKSMMSINMGVVCDLMGHVDHAVQWYSHAVELEKPYSRCFAAQQKAVFLCKKGRLDEAIEIFRSLEGEAYLTLGEATHIQQQLAVWTAAPKT